MKETWNRAIMGQEPPKPLARYRIKAVRGRTVDIVYAVQKRFWFFWWVEIDRTVEERHARERLFIHKRDDAERAAQVKPGTIIHEE